MLSTDSRGLTLGIYHRPLTVALWKGAVPGSGVGGRSNLFSRIKIPTYLSTTTKSLLSVYLST